MRECTCVCNIYAGSWKNLRDTKRRFQLLLSGAFRFRRIDRAGGGQEARVCIAIFGASHWQKSSSYSLLWRELKRELNAEDTPKNPSLSWGKRKNKGKYCGANKVWGFMLIIPTAYRSSAKQYLKQKPILARSNLRSLHLRPARKGRRKSQCMPWWIAPSSSCPYDTHY